MKINTEGEYEIASTRADEIFEAKEGTPEKEELKVLLKALKEYEDDFVKFLKSYS